jgi:outer membrane protein insertion porin family
MNKRGCIGFHSVRNMFAIALIAIIYFSLSACNPTRRLATDQQLYLEPEITFDSSSVVQRRKLLKEELLDLVRPQANSGLKLWIYNLFDEPKQQKGFKYWLKYKVGEAPVLYNPELAERSSLVLQKKLEDEGYLHAGIHLDTLQTKQGVRSVYTVKAEKRYQINQVFLPDSSSSLGQLTKRHQKKSLLNPGQFYNVSNLKAERQRLVTIATQNGYYGLTYNDIYFYVDTIKDTDALDLYLRWKVDSTDLKKHRLGETIIYPNYSLNPARQQEQDTLSYEGLTIIENQFFIKEALLRRAIRGQKNDLYDGRLQKSTISYLQNLDVFKFINLQNEQRITDSANLVDRTFYLTPARVRDIRLDFETNTRSGSYFGISTSANFTNRNLLGGAERLDLGLSVGAETQPGGVGQFINTFEVKAEAGLSLPKLLVPFNTDAIYQNYVARTRFLLSNAYQVRNGFFTTNRLMAEMTYDWRSNRMLHTRFSPFLISFNRTFSIDPEFQEELAGNRRLSESLEDFVLLGGQYRMTYSSEDLKEKKPYIFFSTHLKVAGNIPYLTAGLINAENEPYRFLGTPFSQFAKLTIDARHYRPRRKQALAFRFHSGLAVPYGNSQVVPYAEQFFIGGSTSVRAFRLRQLGPGTFVNPNIEDLDFFDQTGDIKLELNAEYRFDIAAYFKGAVFLDAGNIWLLNETVGDLNEGRFQFDSFFEELAVGTGLGLRLDVSYFVIRLDAAFPLRKPVFGQGFQWTFSEINPLNGKWRSDNLVWHLAIGYPF